MAQRPPLPAETERKLLLINGCLCCVCGQHDVQIHHIDGDHGNHNPDNLAVLCLVHHNQAEQAKAAGGNTLSKKLDAPLIRAAKNGHERANAVRLGYTSAEAFWKDVTATTPAPVCKPEFEAVAFRDWQGWQRLQNRVAAYTGPGGKSLCFPIRRIEGSLWCLVVPAVPGHDVREWSGWTQDDGEKVIPLSSATADRHPLVPFGALPLPKQAQLHGRVMEQLEKRRVLEQTGVHAEYVLNGPQTWPATDLDLQIAVCLQNLCVLANYFWLLGSTAGKWQESCARVHWLRSTNTPLDKWDVSLWDAILLEKVEWLVPFLKGRASTLEPHLGKHTRDHIGMSFEEAVSRLVLPPVKRKRLKLDWPRFRDAVLAGLGALCDPTRLRIVADYPNPVLAFHTVIALSGDKALTKLSVNAADLWNPTKHISPAKQAGRCDVRLDTQNEIRLTFALDQRPTDPLAVGKAIYKVRAKQLLTWMRDGKNPAKCVLRLLNTGG